MPDQNIQQSTPGSYLKLLTVIYSALFAGQLLFAVLVFMLKNSTIIDFKNTHDPFLFVVPFMALGAIIGGNFLFKKTLTEATGKETLKQKLMVYLNKVLIIQHNDLNVFERWVAFRIIVFPCQHIENLDR